MICYRTRTGEYVSGETAADVVAALHKASRAPAPNDSEWMYKTAGRVALQTGTRISTRSAQQFLEGLIAAGLIFEETVQ